MGLVDAIQNLFKKKKQTSNNSERKNNRGTGTKASASFSSTSAKKVSNKSTQVYHDLGTQVSSSINNAYKAQKTKQGKTPSSRNTVKANTSKNSSPRKNTNTSTRANYRNSSDDTMRAFTNHISASSPMNVGVTSKNRELSRKEAENRINGWHNLGNTVAKENSARKQRVQQYKKQGMTESQIIHQLKKDADYSNTGNVVYDKLHNFGHGANEVLNKAAEGAVNSVQSLVNAVPQAAQVAQNGRNDNAERNAILRSYMNQGYSPTEAKALAEKAQLTHTNDTDIIDSKTMDAINRPFDKANEYLEGISNDYKDTKNLSENQKAVIGHVANVAQNATNNITNMVAGAALSAATGGVINPATAGLVTMGMNSYGNTFATDIQEQRQAAAQQIYDYIIAKGGTPEMAAKWYNYYLKNANVDIEHAHTRAILDAANEELQEQISPFGSNITRITPRLTDLAMEGVQEGVGTLLDPYNDIITANVHDKSKIPEQMLSQLKTDVGMSGDKEATADRWKDVGKSALGGVESSLVLGGITNPVQTYNSLKNDVKSAGAAVTGRDAYTSDLMAREIDKNIKVAEDAVKMGDNSDSSRAALNKLYDQKMETDRTFISREKLNSENYAERRAARNAAADLLKTSAKRYGIKNESLVNDISEISNKVGVSVRFSDSMADNVDGVYRDGVIEISSKAKDTATVFSHELTHALENSDSYVPYVTHLEGLARNGMIDYGYDSIDSLKQAIRDTYGGNASENTINSEAVAHLTEKLFGNKKAIRALAKENRNVATRIVSWINDTIKTVGNSQARSLVKTKRMFESAIRDANIQETGIDQYKLTGKEKIIVDPNGEIYFGLEEDKAPDEKVEDIPEGVDLKKFGKLTDSDEFFDVQDNLRAALRAGKITKEAFYDGQMDWLTSRSAVKAENTEEKAGKEKSKAMTSAERQAKHRAKVKAEKEAKAQQEAENGPAKKVSDLVKQYGTSADEAKTESVINDLLKNHSDQNVTKEEYSDAMNALVEQGVDKARAGWIMKQAGFKIADTATQEAKEEPKAKEETKAKPKKTKKAEKKAKKQEEPVPVQESLNLEEETPVQEKIPLEQTVEAPDEPEVKTEQADEGKPTKGEEKPTEEVEKSTEDEEKPTEDFVEYDDLDTDASVEPQLKSLADNGMAPSIADLEELYEEHSNGAHDPRAAAEAMRKHYYDLLEAKEKNSTVKEDVKKAIESGDNASEVIKDSIKAAETEDEKKEAANQVANAINEYIREKAEKLSGKKLSEEQENADRRIAQEAAESEKADAEYEQKAEEVKKEQEEKNKDKAEEDKTNVTDSVEITDAYRSALKSYSIPQAFKKVIMDIFKNKDSVTHERIVHEVISNEDMIAVGEKNWAELGVAGVRKLAEEYNTDKNSSSKASPLSLEHEATLEVALVHMGQQMDSLQKAYEKFEDKMTADQKAEYQKIFNDYMNSYNVIFDSFANAGTNYGRLLQARKMLYKNKYARWAKYEKGMSQIAEKMGKDISDIMKGQKEKYDAAETDEQRDEILQETDKLLSQRLATRLDKMSQWRYTAMLCNPRAFIRNDVSNGLTYGMFRLSDWNSVVLEKAIKKVAGQDVTKSHVLKVKREYLDFSKQYISENGLNAAGETKYHEGQLRTDRAFSDNSKMGAVLNNISEWTSNKLNKSDDLFISMRASNYLAQQLQAGGYTLKEGKLFKKGKELTEAQQNSALAKMGARAYRSAMEATYHDASDLADAINKARKNSTAARVFLDAAMPFTKTPINIAKRSVEFSPVGFIKNVTYDYYQVKQGKMDANTFIENLSKGMTGTEMAAVGAWLAAQGILHGGGDDDKDKDETYYRGDIYGDQDYALYIGDYRVSLDWAMPSVSAACMGAQAFLDMKKRMDGGDMSFGDFMLGSAKALSTILDPIMSMTMFGTINDLMQTFVNNGDKVGALSAFLMSVGGNLVNQYVPTIFGALNRSFMSRKRYAYNTDLGKNYLNNILTRVPGAASVLPVTIDDNGNEVLNTGTIYGVKADEAFDSGENLGKYAVDSASRLFYNMLVPATITRSKKDNTSDELLRLKSQGQDVLPGNIYKIYGSLDEDGNYKEDIAITGSDLMNAKAIYAKEYKQYADAFIKSDMYTMMDQGTKSNDEFKGKVLKGLYNYAVDKARVDYFGEAGLKYDKVLKGTDKALFELEKKGVSPVTILAIRNSGLTGTERSYAARTVLDEAGALDTVRKLAEDGTINLSDVGLNKTVANMTDEEFSYAASHMEEKEKKEKALYNPEDLIEKERIQEVMNAAGVPDASLYSARYAESDKDRYGNNITYSQDINARKELGEENVEKIKEAVENGEMTMDEAAIYTSISKKVLSMDTESFNDFADNNVSNYETAMNTAMQIGVNTDNLLAAREATSDYDNTGATIKYSKGINARKMLGEENVQKYKDAIAEGIITLDDAVKQTGISKSVFKLSTAAFNRKYGDYVYSPFGDTETAKAASKSYKSGRKKKGSGDSSDTDETGETIKTSKEAKEEEKKRLAALKAFAEAMSKGTKAVASASDKGLKNSMSELSKLTDQQIYQKVMSSKSLENKLGLKGIKIESSK